MPGPKLVFAHIVSPHPPFVFDENGQALEPSSPYSMNDGDDYKGTLEEYRAGYPGQVRFVNRQLQQVVDALLAQSEAPPLIIIQGDHGPGMSLDRTRRITPVFGSAARSSTPTTCPASMRGSSTLPSLR